MKIRINLSEAKDPKEDLKAKKAEDKKAADKKAADKKKVEDKKAADKKKADDKKAKAKLKETLYPMISKMIKENFNEKPQGGQADVINTSDEKRFGDALDKSPLVGKTLDSIDQTADLDGAFKVFIEKLGLDPGTPKQIIVQAVQKALKNIAPNSNEIRGKE